MDGFHRRWILKRAVFAGILVGFSLVVGFCYGEVATRKREIICDMDDPINQVRTTDGTYEVTTAFCHDGRRVTLVWHD